MEIISDKIVKTRKKHQCFACLRFFPAGETMRAQTNKYDGIATVYSCSTCDKLLDKFHSLFFDDSEMIFHYGCVNEALSDYKQSTPEELLKTLSLT